MNRRTIGMLCALVLLFCSAAGPVLAIDNGADPLNLEELRAWITSLEAYAAGEELLNDPSEAEYHTEDGYAYIYEFGTLYYSRPAAGEDTVLMAAVIYDDEVPGPRDTRTEMSAEDLLASYYTENETLLGTRDRALIYLADHMPEGLWWAKALRDGQRLETVQYTVHESAGDGMYTDCGLVYTLQENTVVAIRAFGLSAVVDRDGIMAEETLLLPELDESEYSMVPSSTNGSELQPFGPQDLAFLGIEFPGCTPEDAIAALGVPEADETVPDGRGSEMRTLSFDGCTFVYRITGKAKQPQLTMITITGEELEGPRAVRPGDSIAAVRQRFRFGDGAVDETLAEVLYGTPSGTEWGLAEYGEDASAVIRYGFTPEDGRQVVLMMNFDLLRLTEINVFLVQE